MSDKAQPCQWCGDRKCACMSYVLCSTSGTIGHMHCGFCIKCKTPRIMCGHTLILMSEEDYMTKGRYAPPAKHTKEEANAYQA